MKVWMYVNPWLVCPEIPVFIPTSPNPTSGFLIFVPKEDIKELDITLVQLDQTTAETLGIDPSTSGILVKTVGENNKNLMVNDVIIQVSSEKITDLPSFEKMLSDSLKLKRDKLLLRVIREGNEFWLINPLVIE